MLIPIRRESGFTLVELMVGLVISLLVLGGVLSVYLSTIKTSRSTIQSSRLNQEMGAIMNIMANDIRRAGYWDGGATSSALDNLFSQTDSTALEVHLLTAGTYADAGVQGNGSCVVYAYDLSNDGVLDDGTGNPDEGFGFRWDGAGNGIVMKKGHTDVNDCSSTGENWEPLTDTGFIDITNLNFSLANSQCLNTSEPNEETETTGVAVAAASEIFAERDCYNATYAPDPSDSAAATTDADEITVEIREVLITLSASLVDEPEVTLTMQQSVQVRNNHIRQY